MEWLQQLLDRLFSFIPRIWLVAPDEAGVRITGGKRYRTTPPGWYIYWPLLQEMIKISVTPQIKDIRCQSAYTKDYKNICISGAIKYRIKDASAAILKVQDFDATIQALALGILNRYVNGETLVTLSDICNIESIVLKGIKDEARGWGLDIMAVYITDLGETRNIRLLTNSTEKLSLGETE